VFFQVVKCFDIRQQPFSYLGGGGGGGGGGERGAWDFFEKNILMPQLTEKKIRLFIVAEKTFMPSPARKICLREK
jgi:hypothetical protein